MLKITGVKSGVGSGHVPIATYLNILCFASIVHFVYLCKFLEKKRLVLFSFTYLTANCGSNLVQHLRFSTCNNTFLDFNYLVGILLQLPPLSWLKQPYNMNFKGSQEYIQVYIYSFCFIFPFFPLFLKCQSKYVRKRHFSVSYNTVDLFCHIEVMDICNYIDCYSI